MIIYAEKIDQRQNMLAALRVLGAMSGPKLLLDFEGDPTRMFGMKHSHIGNLEWGKQARKREDAQRALNGADRKAAIREGVRTMIEEDEEAMAELIALDQEMSDMLYDEYLDDLYRGLDDYEPYDSPFDAPYDDGPDYYDDYMRDLY